MIYLIVEMFYQQLKYKLGSVYWESKIATKKFTNKVFSNNKIDLPHSIRLTNFDDFCSSSIFPHFLLQRFDRDFLSELGPEGANGFFLNFQENKF